MKKKKYKFIRNLAVPIIIMCAGVLFVVGSPLQGSCTIQGDKWVKNLDAFNGSCTVLVVAHEDDVLFGNNEDFTNPVTYIWSVPPYNGSYGGVYLGYRQGRPHGGINEK